MLPPTAGETSLASLMLGVHDLDRATAFYAHTLGLHLRGRSTGHAFFEAGTVAIILSTELAQARGLHGAMPVEFTFRVGELKPTIEHLLRAGVELHGDARKIKDDEYSISFDDPDGHRLSMMGAMTDEEAGKILRPSIMPQSRTQL